MLIGNHSVKIEELEECRFFSLTEQELQTYKSSMKMYQSDNAFKYFLT